MKNQNNIYGQFGRILVLGGLTFALVISWGWSGQPASAQEGDPPSGKVIPIVEPDSPIAEPTTTPEPTDEPGSDPTGKPGDQETNQPNEQEADPAPVEVIITVEPVASPEPTDESGSTSPDPTSEPDTVIIVDPPSAEELGEPIKDGAYVAKDDVVDDEGGVIDIFDLTFVAARYDTDDPAADINLDGVVDIFDLTILAKHYGQSEPEVDVAAIVTPTPLPIVAKGGSEDYGAFDLPVEVESAKAEVQYYRRSRPLRIGVSLNYVKMYDYMDSSSAPDPYALVAVGRISARTTTVYNQYQAWPYWRLGWWRYAYFPWASRYSSEANNYKLPIDLEIRDDDGRACYGYYGCRNRFQYADISSLRYRQTKRLDFYPSRCMVIDEAGTRTYGQWFDSNRCRVYLQAWGTEWPRAYVSYYIDARWE